MKFVSPRLFRFGMAVGAAGLLGAAALGSCTLLIETRSTQCQNDGDCKGFPHAACHPRDHVCVDTACAKGDCVCDPQTSVDILNGCPKGECFPFDNGQVHLAADAAVPPGPDAAPDPSYVCPSDAGTSDAMVTPPPMCEDDAFTPLYITGPDSITPLLQWVTKRFAGDGTRVIFQANSSCSVVKMAYFADETLNTGMTTFPTWYYDGQGVEHPCYISDVKARPHIALSDVFPRTCGGYDTMGTGGVVEDHAGPVQAMGFVVPDGPEAAAEKSISHEAARAIYGLGADVAKIEPWTDPTFVYQRTPSSGTQKMIARTLGLDPDHFFLATTNKGSTQEAALIGCSTDKEKTLGILAVDIVQSKRFPIRLLAYQSSLQDCAYLPDSTETANDKRNVRDGHYFIWGPIHMLTPKNNPSNDAQALIDLVSGNVPVNDHDIFQIWADAHLVPQCAMHVRRSDDGGPLTRHNPQNPCSCRYDEVTGGNASCQKCTQTTDCPSDRPVCNLGYCELTPDP